MNSPARTGEAGFTLLEVLVAFAVLAVVMGALSSIVGRSAALLSNTRMDQEASRLAEQKVRELTERAESGELPQSGVDEGVFDESGQVGIPYAFRVEIEPYVLQVPRGIPRESLQGSGLFAPPSARGGGGAANGPAIRRVEVRVYREDEEPEQANPFVVFLTEPAEPPQAAAGATGQGTGDLELNQGLGGLNDALRRTRQNQGR